MKSGTKGDGWDHQAASVERKEARKDMCGVGGGWRAVREEGETRRRCIIFMGDAVLTETMFEDGKRNKQVVLERGRR